jgi:hypothetical protein
MVNNGDLCWFCKKNPATDTYIVNLEKKEWQGARFTIHKLDVQILRCDKCRTGKRNLLFLFWLAIGIPVAAFIILIQFPSRISLIIQIVSIIASIALLVLAFFRMKNNQSKGYGHHPEVAAAVKDGYIPITIT